MAAPRPICCLRRGACALLATWLLLACGVGASLPDGAVPIRIDCGNETGLIDTRGISWQEDEYWVDGNLTSIPVLHTDGNPLTPVEQTLHVWYSGDSCYDVPVVPGRYLVRLSFAYNDFDGQFLNDLQQRTLPIMGVSISELFVETVAVLGDSNATAIHTDYIAYSTNDTIAICFMPFTNVPFVNAIEVLPQDSDAYLNDTGIVLSNYARINSGAVSANGANGANGVSDTGVLGPEKNDVAPLSVDPGYRTWTGDVARTAGDPWVPVVTPSGMSIAIPTQFASLHLGPALFQICRKAGAPKNSTGYRFVNVSPVDAANKFLVVLYFAELENAAAGQRVMDLWVNGETRVIDIMSNTMGVGAPNTGMVEQFDDLELLGNVTDGYYILVQVSQNATATLPPVLCGVEVYEIIPPTTPPPGSAGTQIRISCGTFANYTNALGVRWAADFGFSSGEVSNVANPGSDLQIAATLRFFPYPWENCYEVDVAPGRYLVRSFFDYGGKYIDNGVVVKGWDGASQPPEISWAVEGTVLATFTPSAPGFFLESYAYIADGLADICVLGNTDGGPTFINSVEILEMNPQAYFLDEVGQDTSLFTFARLNCGGAGFGDGIDLTPDRGFRQWSVENSTFTTMSCSPSCTTVEYTYAIAGADVAPEYFPLAVFQSARVAAPGANSTIAYFIDMNSRPRNGNGRVLLYAHFVELNSSVKAGDRVMRVLINGQLAFEVDVVAEVGKTLKAYTIPYNVTLPQWETEARVRLVAAPGSKLPPAISGLEFFSVLNPSLLTEPDQRLAMHELRDALQVPKSHNWQGDPCEPNFWKGVSCRQATNRPGGIVAIQLAGIDLAGYLPGSISSLTDLTNLDLSHNKLGGVLPNALGQLPNLALLNLADNFFVGPIPPELGSNPKLHSVLMNDNDLSGQVPPSLVNSVALTTNFSGNAELCGAPTLPACNGAPPPPGFYYPNGTFVPLSHKGSSATAAIVGGVVGGIAGLLVLAAAIFFALRRRHAPPISETREHQQHSGPNPYAKSTSGSFDIEKPSPTSRRSNR